jgi:hypothetical protein
MITRYHVLSAEYKPSGLAAADLTSAASQGVLWVAVARSFPLAEIAAPLNSAERALQPGDPKSIP